MKTISTPGGSRGRRITIAAATLTLALGGVVAGGAPARAEPGREPTDAKYLLLPSIPGWFQGHIALYASTDTSDESVAVATHLNYAPSLAAAANTAAVDDIYTVTNFTQSNIVPSAPEPAGPGNTNKSYSPLWQLSMVTWAAGTTPHTLRSEGEVKAAKASGLVTIVKTNIVINCPIIYTPKGGLFPGAHIIDIGP